MEIEDKSVIRASIVLGVLLLSLQQITAVDSNVNVVCVRRESALKVKFNCPEDGQPPHWTYCCGNQDDEIGQQCCDGFGNETVSQDMMTVNHSRHVRSKPQWNGKKTFKHPDMKSVTKALKKQTIKPQINLTRKPKENHSNGVGPQSWIEAVSGVIGIGAAGIGSAAGFIKHKETNASKELAHENLQPSQQIVEIMDGVKDSTPTPRAHSISNLASHETTCLSIMCSLSFVLLGLYQILL